jgi:RNA polymerase sigma-70 factor (ECF subfamily)
LESDGELVNQVLSGHTKAYTELVRRYETAARAVALGVLGDRHEAEDVAQEAFVQAYCKLDRLRTANSYGPWLLRIVRRHAVRSARRRVDRRLKTVPLETTAVEADALSNGRLAAEHERLLAAVNRLRSGERQAVVLRYFEGHNLRTIAEATGHSEDAVSKQLSRARQRLRQWPTEDER